MIELWLATGNPGKRLELERMLAGLPVRVRLPGELREPFHPVEDSPDFAGNARKKAQLLAKLAGGLALADDSGLCVDALAGDPGVRSARYGGAGLDDLGRLELLLRNLGDVPHPKRTARFHCSLCLCDPDGGVLAEIAATCDGFIRRAPSGGEGFGYDPIFVPREHAANPDASFATLAAAEKDRLSHRGKAMRSLVRTLQVIVGTCPTNA